MSRKQPTPPPVGAIKPDPPPAPPRQRSASDASLTPSAARRLALAQAIDALPDEAYGWFVMWAAGMAARYPDGLGGFSRESRAAITALRAAANAYLGAKE